MISEYKMTLPAFTLENADHKARPVLDKALKEVGFIPNMYAFMVNSPALLETYLHGYGLFRKESGFSPAEQEVVFLAISRENECHYCVAAHSMLAEKKSSVPADVTNALRNGTEIHDNKLRNLATFTKRMVESRGRPDTSDLDAFINAGYTEHHILDIILAISIKTLSNYSNHIFQTPVDDMFGAYAWSG